MPLDTVLCLDVSGSMAGKGLRELQAAVYAFLDGVAQTALQTGLAENVGIVIFGETTGILHHLSTDYVSLKQTVGQFLFILHFNKDRRQQHALYSCGCISIDTLSVNTNAVTAV